MSNQGENNDKIIAQQEQDNAPVSSKKNGFFRALLKHKRFRYGTYSTVLIIVILTVFVMGNVGIAALNDTLNLNLDITRNKLYSLSTATKNILAALGEDIEIYPLYTSDSQIDLVLNTLDNYAALNPRISVEVVDPIRNPGFVIPFQSDGSSISTGSIIVTNAEHTKYRVLTPYEIISYNYNSDYGTTYADAFIGESKITNAIVFITSPNSPRICFLEGHQETSLTAVYYLRSYLEGENFEVKSVTSVDLATLTTDDTLVILSPQRDLSDSERDSIKAFIENNGRMLYLSDEFAPDLPNFESLLKLYGITFNHDYVVETDTSMSYQQAILIPSLESHTVTSALKTNDLAAMLLGSSSFNLPERDEYNVTVTPLMQTSSGAYGKTNYETTNIEMEPGDIYGPLTLGVAVETQNGTGDNDYTRIVLIGDSTFITDSTLYQYSGNVDVFINAVKWMQNRMQTVSIVGKSLQGDRLNLRSEAQQMSLITLVVVVIPLVVLAAGLFIWFRRRHL